MLIILSVVMDHDRRWCIKMLVKVTRPVLWALAERKLKDVFGCGGSDFACMEAFARCLLGVSAFVELDEDIEARELGDLARKAIDAATDPISPDTMPFKVPHQSLVEGALMAQALLIAPSRLWKPLSDRVKQNVLHALKSTRSIPLRENNWVLFGSIIETFLMQHGELADVHQSRLLCGVERYEKWYLGDGVYGDGPQFHFDYYNSYVIHPLLSEVLKAVRTVHIRWEPFHIEERKRLKRYATILERMVATDGSFPPLGRSLTYRCGAFHALAYASLNGMCKGTRATLMRVIKRSLECNGVFDEDGFLRVGLSGHQPSLAEKYINKGSVYMCCAAFLPLGLSATDVYWTDACDKTSWDKAWSGEDCLKCDKALDYKGVSSFIHV